MPPRFAYWTILIDHRPTAFRARDRADLLPTLRQLQRTNRDVILKWFADGRLWESPEQAHWARQHVAKRPTERRGKAWRPGGDHRDPRARHLRRRSVGGPGPSPVESPAPHPPARGRPRAGRRRPAHRAKPERG